jgi:hypothetical protein
MGIRLVSPTLMDPAENTFSILCEKIRAEQLTKAQMLEVYDQLREDLIANGDLDHSKATGHECDCQERFDAIRPRLIEFFDSILTASAIDELYRRKYKRKE